MMDSAPEPTEAISDAQAVVADRLRATYGDFAHYNKRNPLDELIFILGSTRTPERSYRATFRALKKKFPRFHELAAADVDAIAEPLFLGGMYRQKARMLRDILDVITVHFGAPTLAPLRRMDDAECERLLTSLPGVGKKIARCVMMYALDRQVFPVDTHCWRISRRLGWISSRGTADKPSAPEMDRLQEAVTPKLRFSLHVNMISHGRACCTARDPNCGCCVVADLCPKIGVLAPRKDPVGVGRETAPEECVCRGTLAPGTHLQPGS